MLPVLFVIPLHVIGLPDMPLHGYGMMLFLAFIFCILLARRMCRAEGIDGSFVSDLAIALFLTGIIGGRIVYVIQYWEQQRFNQWYWNSLTDNGIRHIISLWDGGLVLYGALIGGAVGYFAYDWLVLSKLHLNRWKMLDVLAPCVALGIALGRIGCLFTGCCYGNVACDSCPSIQFPRPSAPWAEMSRRGYQAPLGFILAGSSLEVEAVEPGSRAEAAGVRAGDHIVAINGKPALNQVQLDRDFGQIALTVQREGANVEIPAFVPVSIEVHPTQIYETISMVLLLFFLLSYHPFKRHDGELMVLLMLCYGVHRFVNEMLRTDTDPVAFGLTLSQNISIAVLAAGGILGVIVWRRPKVEPMPITPLAVRQSAPPES